MEERDAPEVGTYSFIGRQIVGEKSVHPESKEGRGTGLVLTPRLQLPLPDFQLVRLDHALALLAFEWENRAYFAASVPDRGDEFFAKFNTRHAQLLAWQAAGTNYFHLLVGKGGEVVGRVNLTASRASQFHASIKYDAGKGGALHLGQKSLVLLLMVQYLDGASHRV